MRIGTVLKINETSANLYEVVQVSSCDTYIFLKCVYFSEKEDSGDGIWFIKETDRNWVCSYHFKHYHICA